MAADVGGTGMQAIGSLLARGGSQPGPGQGNPQAPAPGGGTDPNTAMQAADAQQSQITATMQQIRDLGKLLQQLAASNPMLADEAQQMQQLLKQMIVKAAQQAPMQTGSSLAVPGGGMAA